jgi:hypothetical protein
MQKSNLNHQSPHLRLCNVSKRFIVPLFAKIKKEVEFSTLANPMVNPDFNELFAQAGYRAFFYEHRVFVNGKPFFVCRSKNVQKFTVKKFLWWLTINVC